MKPTETQSNKCAGGWHKQYRHISTVLDCDMHFSLFLPPNATHKQPVPVLYWLSGLTCTDENFMQKAAALQHAAEQGIAIVAPDTSPRGEDIPDDPEGAYDLGLGAGFYLNATTDPWQPYYQMYDYIRDELPALIESTFPVTDKRAISGHSMGGHGALVMALRNPERFQSVSAFSPICNPVNCPWGQKAFSHYLGYDKAIWDAYDASVLITQCKTVLPMLIDQGDKDPFLAQQLKPEALVAAAATVDYPLRYRLQPDYNHSYYFIASFIADHVKFHAGFLFDQG